MDNVLLCHGKHLWKIKKRQAPVSKLRPVSQKCVTGYMMSITQTETLLCDPHTVAQTPLYHHAARMSRWAPLANLLPLLV